MYNIDGICYAGNRTEDIRVKEALPLRGDMMFVTFNTGKKRLFDTTLLQGGAFEALKDEVVFKKVSVSHGVMTWNNGEIDIALETIYAESLPV